MTVEITPELIAICLTFVGLVIGFITIGVWLVKIGRWVGHIETTLSNLVEGQKQILAELRSHTHGSGGTPEFSGLPPAPPAPQGATVRPASDSI